MITKKTKTSNYSAISSVNIDDEAKAVMFMNASLSAAGELSFTSSVSNAKLYVEHQEEVDNDYDTWKQEIIDSIKGE